MSKPIPLHPGEFYHIYNRGNNREDIFIENRNYRHFMKLYAKYIEPVADTFAHCLLRNHFHFLVRIKRPQGFQKTLGVSSGVSQQFGNLFNAYAKAINKAYGRTGSLFQNPFQRVHVDSDAYFTGLVTYIHHNPQKHGLANDFRAWPHSSYRTLLSAQATRLKREDTLAWFGGVDSFVALHEQESDECQVALWTLE
ncbi:MAG: hypothetical protein GY832_33060 [Chloroflexi bacterium]|nr:hypothetical protein [Chloroflexota bacterium]